MSDEPITQLARDAAAKHAANGMIGNDIVSRIKLGDFDHHESVRCFLDLAIEVAAETKAKNDG